MNFATSEKASVSIALGASLWWVSSANTREECEVSVIRVDGQRASLSNGADIDLDTLNAIADPISRGRCYLTRDEHLESLRLIEEWADFVRDVRSVARPKNISVAEIGELRNHLGIGRNQRKRW